MPAFVNLVPSSVSLICRKCSSLFSWPTWLLWLWTWPCFPHHDQPDFCISISCWLFSNSVLFKNEHDFSIINYGSQWGSGEETGYYYNKSFLIYIYIYKTRWLICTTRFVHDPNLEVHPNEYVPHPLCPKTTQGSNDQKPDKDSASPSTLDISESPSDSVLIISSVLHTPSSSESLSHSCQTLQQLHF